MIPNLLNTLIGLWLIYTAVLKPDWFGSSLPLAATGIVVLLLALWARPADYGKWHSSTNMVMGIILMLFAGVHKAGLVTPLLSFWIPFWGGMLISVVALWAALYRPHAQASKSEE